MAVGCTDGVVRIFDRRMMPANRSVESAADLSASRSSPLEGAFMKFLPPSNPSSSKPRSSSHGIPVRKRITSLKWCPRWGNELLASYSSDSVYLFALDPNCRSAQRGLSKGGTSRKAACAETVFPKKLRSQEEESAGAEEGSEALEGTREERTPQRVLQRLRLRGDWSDTGPQSRPQFPDTPGSQQERGNESGETANFNESDGRSDLEPPSYISRLSTLFNNAFRNQADTQSSAPEVSASTNEQGASDDEESSRRRYVQVREEVMNTPVVSQSIAPGNLNQSENTLVFVREEAGFQEGSSPNVEEGNNLRVYMGPSGRGNAESAPSDEMPNDSFTSPEAEADIFSPEASNLPLNAQTEGISTSENQTQTSAGTSREDTTETQPEPQVERDPEVNQEPSEREVLSRGRASVDQRWASVTGRLIDVVRARRQAPHTRTRDRQARMRNLLLGGGGGGSRRTGQSNDANAENNDSGDESVMRDESYDNGSDSEREEKEQKNAEIDSLLMLPHAHLVAKYSGHRNSRTMIKQCNFWGEDHVITGSDCGHVFIYNRHSAQLVDVIEADRHVVNCVQPHPTEFLLATSGIDYDIKLWRPTSKAAESHPEMWEIVDRNSLMQRQTQVFQDLITVPAAFMLRLLAMASARAARNSPPPSLPPQVPSDPPPDYNRPSPGAED